MSCGGCIRTKQHRVSFPSQPYKSTQPFTLVHSDVWEPSKVTTSSNKWWFVTFIDDHTRLTWVFLISDKYEVASTFQNFYHTVETQFNAKTVILGSSNGREFQNHTLNKFLSSKGIAPEFLCLQPLNKMGLLRERTVTFWKLSVLLCCLFPFLSIYADVLTAAHLINQIPSHILHLQTPLECLKELYPSTHLISNVSLQVHSLCSQSWS